MSACGTVTPIMRVRTLNHEDTHGKILYLLKTRGKLSVDDLARELDQSGVNVRRHLDVMERDELVCSIVHKRERGRPTSLYFLTERGHELFPHAYDTLSVDIFEQVEQLFGRQAVRDILEGRADKLIRQLKPTLENKSFDEKVEELSHVLNSMGYMARAEHTSKTESCLLIHHCPVLRIAGKYKEVCDTDCRIVRDALQARVERTCALSEGSGFCGFQVTLLPS